MAATAPNTLSAICTGSAYGRAGADPVTQHLQTAWQVVMRPPGSRKAGQGRAERPPRGEALTGQSKT